MRRSESSRPKRGVSRASPIASGERDWATTPATPAAELDLVPTTPAVAGPQAALATSSSSSSTLQHGGLGLEQLGRLPDDLVEGSSRIELGREQAADVREALGERARPPLALEELCALDRAARGPGEVAGKREVVVGERARVSEENDGRVLLPSRTCNGGAEQRPVANLAQEVAQSFGEALVLAPARGGQNPLATRAAVANGAAASGKPRASSSARAAGSSCAPAT